MSEPKKKSSIGRTIGRIIVGIVVVGFLAVVIPNFVRARYSTAKNSCINNLRQIDGAKQQWALENRKTGVDVPAPDDIKVYIKNDKMPVCPLGGTYIVGHVSEDPRCSIGALAWPNEHVLPDALNEPAGWLASWWANFKTAYSILLGLRPAPPTP